MFETSGVTRKLFDNLTSFETKTAISVPTFERTLDSYFERNMDSIIEEWGLITEADLNEYARKLEYLSYEVGRLYAEKDLLKKRAEGIEKSIKKLEAGK
ncbi:MAG TPA: hypothetical protein PK024_04370 [Methanospirillum sp.]|uniref:hypothetical protein n=1 Tax=Methanospirillum sp. TaxID=45200 RepID=UPI002BAEAE76|nr:hypothetical protein [Methanospirillum sp.]HOJ96058.1 hypothetical protein [Methanospirillum sp.]HPP77805.1 hypothetical protein [Methanospirillum sp.]